MSIRVNVENPGIDHRSQSLSQPDDKKIFWSKPNDMKLQIYAVLRAVLDCLNMQHVPVLQDGAFTETQLRNEFGESQTVVTVGRTSDVGFRRAIGDELVTVTTPSPYLLDPCGILPPGTVAQIFAEWSTEQCDVTIADLDSFRANEMYQIIKTIMIFAGEQFRNIGYEDFKRTNGVDQAVSIDSPSSGVVFMRVLSYMGTHRDEAIALPEIVNLVEQKQTITEQGSSTGPTVTSGL